MKYQPLNNGIAYDDMTPARKQEYHARIAATRRPGSGGLTPISEILSIALNEIADAALNQKGVA